MHQWRHSQVVRHGSAKPLCPSSNLGGASNNPNKPFDFWITRKNIAEVAESADARDLKSLGG